MPVYYSKKAIKYIQKADKITKIRIKEAIEKYPFGDIKKLKGTENGYRLRVGDLRILYSEENGDIYIDNIMSKGQVYKRM